jgi:hypothetical protein
MVLLAHWWNRSWSTGRSRKDIWVELCDDGRYLVRWRGGSWHPDEGVCWRADKRSAWAAVRQLLSDGSDWQRVR